MAPSLNVAGFQHRDDAERFLAELRDRLAKFGLELHAEKTRLIQFGRFAAQQREQRGLGKPETFDFLGFTHICGKTKSGRFALRRITISKRMRAKLHHVKEELVHRRYLPIPEQGEWLGSVVRGHCAYYAVPGNYKAVDAFHEEAVKHWYRALRRRSQRTSLTWERMSRLEARWIPPAKIMHPWPNVRFDARYPRQEPRALAVHAGICAGGSPSPQGEGLSLPRLIDLDIRAFFDRVRWDPVLKAVARHTDQRWVLMYVERWLKAPLQREDGSLVERNRGTPQGSAISPLLANTFLHYAFDVWIAREYPRVRFERYCDDVIVHASSERQALQLRAAIARRLAECGLELNERKTRIVYCKDRTRRGSYEHERFDFLGYTFRPRLSGGKLGGQFVNFLPAIGDDERKRIGRVIRSWRLHRWSDSALTNLAEAISSGQLNVGPGQSALIGPGASVSGPVTVQAGGAVEIDGARINGPLKAGGPAEVRVCNATVTGPTTIGGASGLVTFGDGTAGCPGNKFTGPVRITNNTGGVIFDHNTITGPLTITGNTGTLPTPHTGTVEAIANTATGKTDIQQQ